MNLIPRRWRAATENETIFGALRVMSDLLSRGRIASRAGITMGGNRDLYEVLGYKRVLLCQDFRDRYRRGGIAARVVEALPRGTWRGGASLIEDQDPEKSTPFEEAFEELAERLQLWQNLLRADVLAGLGRYAIIVVGAPGLTSEPMPKKVAADKIAYLSPYPEEDAKVRTLETDEQSPRYGLPLTYQVKRSGETKDTSVSKTVHWSRVIHVAEGLLEDRIYGLPRLERIWNDLDNLDKVCGAGAEAFWLRAHQGYHYDLDKDAAPLGDPEKAKLQAAAEEMANGMRRTIATKGMKVTPLGSDVANFSNPVDSIITVIAGATEIPKRILVGSERGELSSAQDKTSWDERINDRRQEYAEPGVLRPLIKMLIELGALPEPKEYKVLWPDVAVLNMKDAATVAVQWSSLVAARVVTPEEIRDRVLGLEALDDEQIAAMDEEAARKVEQQQELFKQQGGKPGEEGEAAEGDEEIPGKKPDMSKVKAAKMRALRRSGKALPRERRDRGLRLLTRPTSRLTRGGRRLLA